MQQLDEAFSYVRARRPDAQPTHGLVLGSGWSEVVEAFEIIDAVDYSEIPGLGKTGVVGHAGRLSWARCAGLETLIFQGRRHYYEGIGWTPIALPIYVLKQMGVSTVLLTNAAGGVREDLTPGSLMALSDHVNNMGVNPLLGPHQSVWGPRFPDQSHVYDSELTALLTQAGNKVDVNVSHGVYFASSGPAYETPAEIRAFKRMGADAVGMSTVPEAMLAHAAGLRVVALSCITNLAAGINPVNLTHEEVTDTTRQTMPRMKKLLAAYWEELAHAQTNA
jgi:purine-nucleoside phosphorylase